MTAGCALRRCRPTRAAPARLLRVSRVARGPGFCARSRALTPSRTLSSNAVSSPRCSAMLSAIAFSIFSAKSRMRAPYAFLERHVNCLSRRSSIPVPPRRFGNPANNGNRLTPRSRRLSPVPPPISNQISRDFRGTLRKEQVSPRSESAHRLASDPYEVEAPVDFGAARGGRVSTVVPLSLRVFGSVSLARGATRGSMTGCGPDRTRRRPATD